MSWDTDLNPQSAAYQIAADASRFIRVLAGPGTGKSFSLKRRVARLLETGTEPARILPVTFTKVAAEDLQRELSGMQVHGAAQLRGSTLHALGMRLLGRQNVFAVTGRAARPLNRFEIEPLLYDLPSAFGGKRDKQKMVRAYEAAWARLQSEEPGYAQAPKDAQFQQHLLNWLRFHEGMLIGEIIPELYRYLRNNPLAPERRLYDHVLVDEYQDLNKSEQAVIDLISEHASLCVVGDDDQSLYSFKHAHPEGIRTFPATHPGTIDHALVECFRCPTRIVAAANSLISNNADREARTLTPIAGNGQGTLEILQFENVEQEAQAIASWIDRQINAHGRTPGEILVLAQRRTIGNPIHAALRARGIPSKSYYQESEIDSQTAQERLAILKLFVNRADRIALRWLLGVGATDFRAKPYARVRTQCEQSGLSLWDVMEGLSNSSIKIPHTSSLVARFHAIQNELRFLQEHNGIPDFVNRWLRAEFTDASELRVLVATLLAHAPTPAELLSKIVEAVTQPEIPPDVTEVRIMSLHKSKGLSSPVVVIAGCVEGLLPARPDTALPTNQRTAQLEEQRRLFYVGITRVKSVPRANRPGDLLLTGSSSMSLADAMQSGITGAAQNGGTVLLHFSRFAVELGAGAPAPRAG